MFALINNFIAWLGYNYKNIAQIVDSQIAASKQKNLMMSIGSAWTRVLQPESTCRTSNCQQLLQPTLHPNLVLPVIGLERNLVTIIHAHMTQFIQRSSLSRGLKSQVWSSPLFLGSIKSTHQINLALERTDATVCWLCRHTNPWTQVSELRHAL